MARPFHGFVSNAVPPHRDRDERPQPAVGFFLILLLALVAAVWMSYPPVASLLPVHPPG